MTNFVPKTGIPKGQATFCSRRGFRIASKQGMERVSEPRICRALASALAAACILLVFIIPVGVFAEDDHWDEETFPVPRFLDDRASQEVGDRFEAEYVRRLNAAPESERTNTVRAQVFRQLFSEYVSQSRSMPSGKIRSAFSKALGAISTDLFKADVWPDGRVSAPPPWLTVDGLRLMARVPGQSKPANDLIREIIPKIYSRVDPKAAFTLFIRAHRDSDKAAQTKALKTLLQLEPASMYSLAEYIISLEKEQPALHQQLMELMKEMANARYYSADASFRAWAEPEFFAAVSGRCTGECLFDILNASYRGFHHHFRRALDAVPIPIREGKLGLAVRMIRNLSDIAYKNKNDLFYTDHFAELTQLNAKLPPELRLNLLQESIDKTAKKIYRDTPELQEIARRGVTIQGSVARALGQQDCHAFYRQLAYTPEVRRRNRNTLLMGGGALAVLGAGIGIHSSLSVRRDDAREQKEPVHSASEPVVSTTIISPVPVIPPHPVSKRWKEFLEKLSFSPALPEHRIRQQVVEGKQPDFNLVTDTVWDKYLREYQKAPDRPFQYVDLKMLRQLMIRDLPAGAHANAFKVALESKLRDIHPDGLIYNQQYTNPVSTLIDGKDQCSATSLCRDLLQRQHLGQNAYEAGRPVYIVEEGHVLNGLVTDSGELLGLEGTVEGSALKKYGKISELKYKPFAIRVIDAEDYLLADLFAKELSPTDQERLRAVILQATADRFSLPIQDLEQKVSKILPANSALGSHSPLNQSLFSFGSPKAVDGDAERVKAEEVSSEMPGVEVTPHPSKPPENPNPRPPPPELPESEDGLVTAKISEPVPKWKLLPANIIPLSPLALRLADDLDKLYVDSKWHSDRVLVRHGHNALSYVEPLSPESEAQVRFRDGKRLVYESFLYAENSLVRAEGFEKLCRIVGDPAFSEDDRISALVQLMSIGDKQLNQTLSTIKERLPKIYEAANGWIKPNGAP